MQTTTTNPNVSAVRTAAQELIEYLESTGQDYYNHSEAGKVWEDDDEGSISTPPAMVIVLRGIKTDTEAIQVLQSRLLID